MRLSILFLSVLAFTACATGRCKESEFSLSDAEISAMAAVGRLDEAATEPLFAGDGGKDIRIAVLTPTALSMQVTDSWLPVYVQGLFQNNFRKYSAMTVIDRQNITQIISEQGFAASGNFSESDYIRIGQLTNASHFLTGTVQKLPNGDISLSVSISTASTGESKASFMKNGSTEAVQNGNLINEASEAVLSQLGIRLTDTGRRALSSGRYTAVRAEAGYARGMAAQQSGAPVEALLNYSQAVSFDLSQIESLARLGSVSAEISGGSVSERILNDVEARRSWLAAFKEVALFFNEHIPFEITFDPNLMQIGKTDYVHEQADLAMKIELEPSSAGFDALNALIAGLNKTGKRYDWGFNGWPLLDITPKTPEALVFGGKRSFSFKIDTGLVNENGKVIARGSITLETGMLSFAAGAVSVTPPTGASGVVNFPKVNVNDLTPTLTVVIAGVNGMSGRDISERGYIKIATGDFEARDREIKRQEQEKLARDREIERQRQEQARLEQQRREEQAQLERQAEQARLERLREESARQLVRISAGTFMMGSPSSEPGRSSDEGPQHNVSISKPFYMGKYEVTQKEWVNVMGSNPSRFKGDNLPVENVSWFDVIDYCNKRSQKEGLTPAYTISRTNVSWNRSANGYRLPTEAEWEYACRAGTTTPFSTGNNITTSQANYNGNYPYNGNAKGTYREKTTTVGSFAPNNWGLYDMHGNVWEWCWDWYGDYSSSSQTDPMGAASESNRV